MAPPALPQTDVTVVLPCRGQTDALAGCIRKARVAIANLTGEIVVVDVGRANDVRRVALELGARVSLAPSDGTVAAVRAGIESAAGQFIVTAEPDGTYDFSQCGRFVEALQNGADLVIGNRYAGGVSPGAMSFGEQYFATPALNLLGRLFFGAPVHDFHCGMLGLSKQASARLSFDSSYSEFSTDALARASLLRLRIAEAPVTFSAPSGPQSTEPVRRLRFLVKRSPKWIFLYPGVILSLAGALLGVLRPAWMALALGCLLTGFHACLYSVNARIVASATGLIPRSGRFERLLDAISLRKGLSAGAILTLGGMAGVMLDIPNKFPAAAAMFLGVEIVLASLLLMQRGNPASSGGA